MRNTTTTVVIAAGAVLAAAAVTQAATIYVDASNCPGPGDGSELDPYCSIQTAIDNAVDTDEIVVVPGTYFETINFLGKAVWLRSSDGPEVTTIDAQQTGRVVTCEGGEGPDTVIDGFTVTGGLVVGNFMTVLADGGGMYNANSSPTVTNCRFFANEADCTTTGCTARGGGMFNANSSPVIVGCVFEGNLSTHVGGGMYNTDNSNPVLTDCVFLDNSTREGGGVYNDGGGPTFTGCSFEGHTTNQSGAAMYNNGSSPALTSCTIGRNQSVFGAGGGLSNFNMSHPILDGCTFSGNEAMDDGGGIYSDGGSLTVTNCTFNGNMGDDGGGLAISYGTLTVANCTFEGNSADDQSQPSGGGIYCFRTDGMITNCSFSENSAGRGGAIFSARGSLTLVGSTIVQNLSPGPSGAGGGGVWGGDSQLLFIDCLISENSSMGGAGAGGIVVATFNFPEFPVAEATLVNCVISGNSAAFAGGLAAQDALATFVGCTISGNEALVGQAGGVCVNDTDGLEGSGLLMTNVLVIHNSAVTRGGGIAVNDDIGLANCTFSGNSAGESGGAIDAVDENASGTVYNSILWGNTPDQLASSGTTLVRYSNIQGIEFGDTNIDADPLFVDPLTDDFRLLPGSPSIDAGVNTAIADLTDTDLDGNPRFADDPTTDDTGCGVPAVVDMGAYEYQGDPFPVKFGDVDGDGIVGLIDFSDLLAAWGACTEACCLADLDLDGNVGIIDFLLLLGNWG